MPGQRHVEHGEQFAVLAGGHTLHLHRRFMEHLQPGFSQPGTQRLAKCRDSQLLVCNGSAAVVAMAGTLGIAAYGYAMRVLGPTRPALVGALVPVVSSIGGAWLLGETMDRSAWCGVALVTVGIAAITMGNAVRPVEK